MPHEQLAEVKMTTVLLRFADGSFQRATLPEDKLESAKKVRAEAGEEAYRQCLRDLAADYVAAKRKGS